MGMPIHKMSILIPILTPLKVSGARKAFERGKTSRFITDQEKMPNKLPLIMTFFFKNGKTW